MTYRAGDHRGVRPQPVTDALHSGAIGWVTLGILASVLWLYGGTAPRQGEERWITWTSLALIVGVPLYIVAWWTGNLPFRAITGAVVLVGILMYVGWLVRESARIGYRRLTSPQLGAVVGLITLVVGFVRAPLAASLHASPSKPPSNVYMDR